MKTKYSKAIAGGLLAFMIATNSASCGQTNQLNSTTDRNIIYNQVGGTNGGGLIQSQIQNIITSGGSVKPNQTSNSTTSKPSTPNQNGVLGGSVWNAIKNKPEVNKTYSNSNENLETCALPLQFLAEQGVLYLNEYGKISVNGKQPNKSYNPFTTMTYVDNNTKENDVYLLIQYASDDLGQNKTNPDIYLGTWRIKYELDDEDYKTFLALEDDYRIRYFIQEMDKQYEPEIISKSLVSHDILVRCSHVRDEHWTKKGFPYIFVDSVDYNTQTIRYGAMEGNTLKYIDVNIRDVSAWVLAITRDGLTEEEREQSIEMGTKMTSIGNCLTSFEVSRWSGGISVDQAKEAFKNTTNKQEVEFINTSSDKIKNQMLK